MSMLLAAGLVVGAIGLVLGCAIGLAVLFFSVKSDDRIEKIASLLPGANCGGCGFAGCGDFARAIVEENADPSKCVACTAESAARIGEVLGRAVAAREKMVAVVYCSGDQFHAVRCAEYNGLSDCRAAASYAGGGKGCRYGCVGMGTCARNCPFGAIEVRNGRAVVHPELCTGCGKCVSLCPRKLIHLVPADSKAHIYCNSLEKGAVKRKLCNAGCLGCKKCVRAFPDLFIATGGLVRAVNPAALDKTMLEKISCPVHVLHLVEEDFPCTGCEKGSGEKADGKGEEK
ncbi:MAG: 4Fe-4S dicluster domain-containing protein [Lentisphaeria bacterium]|nr:4Fe-4S dicluster domain-containing protein [Lentisphaeria bacterium]